MSPQEAKIISEFLVSCLQSEAAITKRVIAAVPADKPDYAPDAKSMKALDLAWHVASSEVMIINMAVAGGDAQEPERPATANTPQGIAEWYEGAQKEALAKLKNLDGEHLAKVISVWGGMFTAPVVNFANVALVHAIHHRGQLSAYLRPMGGKVPSIYGPSGDEGVGA